MRGKRSKQYRKLMNKYQLHFGFREPYQVLVDAEMLRDADRFKMDLIGGLERSLHGKVKPMITQCSMRHLYATSSEPGTAYLIDKAKTYERRRCGHHPTEYPEPLSTHACLASVVAPKNNKTNKNCYVVASQDSETRQNMREILGVPLVYIKRSVMVMEPVTAATAEHIAREEGRKFREGIKGGRSSTGKRKRDDEGESVGEKGVDEVVSKKKKVARGTKGPNPLAVKKSKKKSEGEIIKSTSRNEGQKETVIKESGAEGEDGTDTLPKKKRRRKHKAGAGVDSEAIEAMGEN